MDALTRVERWGWLGLACVSLMGVWFGVAEAHPGDEPLPVPEHAADATVEQWLGTWQGEWDGRWGVRFTVERSPDPEAEPGEVLVIYEWEETLGRPWRGRRLVGELKDGVIKTRLIELYLSPKDAAEATAIGRFRHERQAELKKREAVEGEGGGVGVE